MLSKQEKNTSRGHIFNSVIFLSTILSNEYSILQLKYFKMRANCVLMDIKTDMNYHALSVFMWWTAKSWHFYLFFEIVNFF